MSLLTATIVHLFITMGGVGIAVLLGIPLGILISKKSQLAAPIMTIADIIQTVPSLAMLALLMILFGLGNTTVIIGLCLYSLLPVIRNTYTGIIGVASSVREAARGMGMNLWQSLAWVELPLASPMIFSGIRIAFVQGLGTAVIGVLIGSGGLGGVIYGGIQQQDWGMIMEGTIPVVLLSLLAQMLFNKIQSPGKKRRKTNAS